MPTTPSSQLPKEMDVAYFVNLHLDTIKATSEPSHREGHCFYRVEGKPRPMLVLTVLHDQRDRRRFLVLPITSKGKDANKRLKRGRFPIGKLPGSDRDSYIRSDDMKILPENMVHHASNRSPVIHSMDRFEFDNVVRISASYSMKAK